MAALTTSALVTKAAKAVAAPSPEGANFLDTIENKLVSVALNLIMPGGAISDAIAFEVVKLKPMFRLFTAGILVFLCALLSPRGPMVAAPNGEITYPEQLKTVVNSNFDASLSWPQLTPLGVKEHTVVTAGYRSLGYFALFQRWHDGVDIIPAPLYMVRDPGFLAYFDIVLYATCTGKASSLIDDGGGLYISIDCDDKKHRVIILHNKLNFIPQGASVRVQAGQPVALMGSTGYSTGPHVHYAVRDLETWNYIDPWLDLTPTSVPAN